MSSKEEKRAKRLENKKRKIEAFLNVAKLNETDVVKKRKVERTSENFNLLVNSVDNGNVFHSQFMFYYCKTSKGGRRMCHFLKLFFKTQVTKPKN